MRRHLRSLPFAIITFGLGVLLTLASWQFYPRRVTLSALAHNPAAYDGKLVRVEAVASSVGTSVDDEPHNIIISQTGCTEPDCWASVWPDQSQVTDARFNEFINVSYLQVKNAKVLVEGKFDQWASLGCFAPRFGIKKARITLLSEITTESLPIHQALPKSEYEVK